MNSILAKTIVLEFLLVYLNVTIVISTYTALFIPINWISVLIGYFVLNRIMYYSVRVMYPAAEEKVDKD